ncbi:MAG TPA: RICIN domain-containing protein, partial [Rhizobacter sp.]|nr:RICIN domain-containing protein [Rhizobacter sp.]
MTTRTLLPLACLAAVLTVACGAGSDDAKSPEASADADTREHAMAVSADSVPTTRYVLVNALSGKCVDVAGASMVDGGNIQQATCNTNLAQVFDVTQTSAGIYKLKNVGSGKMMDVSGSSTADGGNVQQWIDNGTNAQRFRITRTQGNRYVLTNVNSGKCVDVASASLNDGANIQQWGCNGTGAQQFHFYPRTDAGRTALPVGQYTITSNHSRLCLDIAGSSTANSARVVQNACSSSTSQRFDVLPEVGGSYRLS